MPGMTTRKNLRGFKLIVLFFSLFLLPVGISLCTMLTSGDSPASLIIIVVVRQNVHTQEQQTLSMESRDLQQNKGFRTTMKQITNKTWTNSAKYRIFQQTYNHCFNLLRVLLSIQDGSANIIVCQFNDRDLKLSETEYIEALVADKTLKIAELKGSSSYILLNLPRMSELCYRQRTNQIIKRVFIAKLFE